MRLTRLSIAAAFVLVAAGAAAAPVLTPHRAVYDLSLDEATDRSGITGVSGRMVYEFEGSSCDGYTVSFRFVTRIVTPDVTRMTDQQTTTYEDGAGETFSFVTKSFVDRTLDREIRGDASLVDGKTVVEIDEPEDATVELPATQFPTQHLIELLGKARQGERFYETTIFDGSEEADKVMTTTVVIGEANAPDGDDPELAALGSLESDRVWPVDIAYFDLDETDGEGTPDYRISFKLHPGGVTRDLVMDYGEFALAGELAEFAVLDAPECAE